MARPTQPEKPSLTTVAASGDRLATLRELRDVIAAALISPDAAARDVAALSRQLTQVMAEIAELSPSEVKGTPLDELNQRRAARGSAPARAAGSGRTR